MHAHSKETADWWAQPRHNNGANWIENYQKSLHARHRDVIADIVKAIAPRSILEIGCHCGPNMIRLAQDVPSLEDVAGLDPSKQAIDAGTKWAQSVGLSSRVSFRVGRFPRDTEAFPTGCADVVLSCYTLSYLWPSDLDAALYECGRLASRAVILAEPMPVEGQDAPPPQVNPGGYQEWMHDYVKNAKWIGSLQGMTVSMYTIAPPVDRLNAVCVLERVAH